MCHAVPARTSPTASHRNSAATGTKFLQLAEHGLTVGASSLGDLDQALALVRGRPFEPRAQPWCEPLQQEMIVRITDVAHTIATLRTPPGPHHDLPAARHAITVGLDVDEAAELLYRDWMRLEHTAGNRAGLHTVITCFQAINRALQVDPEPETGALIEDLLNQPPASARAVKAQPATTHGTRNAT